MHSSVNCSFKSCNTICVDHWIWKMWQSFIVSRSICLGNSAYKNFVNCLQWNSKKYFHFCSDLFRSGMKNGGCSWNVQYIFFMLLTSRNYCFVSFKAIQIFRQPSAGFSRTFSPQKRHRPAFCETVKASCDIFPFTESENSEQNYKTVGLCRHV